MSDWYADALKRELEIVRSAKNSLMRYTEKCRQERDYWQTRALNAEKELYQRLKGADSK